MLPILGVLRFIADNRIPSQPHPQMAETAQEAAKVGA